MNKKTAELRLSTGLELAPAEEERLVTVSRPTAPLARRYANHSSERSSRSLVASYAAVLVAASLLADPVMAQLTAIGSQFWHQNTAGMLDMAEMFDEFGNSVATGDFDDDGFDDLVIGIHQESLPEVSAGAIQVLYGTASGPAATDNQFLHQGNISGGEFVEMSDFFGSSLAVGNFNGDTEDDLAVGVPGEDINSPGIVRAGAVHTIHGAPDGLLPGTGRFIFQGSEGMLDQPEENDRWGSVLAAGDFDDDGFDDLAVGCPGEDLIISGEGAVQVIYGDPGGLETTDNQFWTQNSPGISDVAEHNDHFGAALAVGDFDDDGFDDLAIGVPLEDTDTLDDVGIVHVLYGTTDGLASANSQIWAQVDGIVLGDLEEGDAFGNALTAFDFNGDGFADLAVGVPDEDIGAIQNAGAVNVLYGGTDGLTSTDNEFWHQDSPGLKGDSETDDRLGASLTGGDFNNDGFADLAIGIQETVGTVVDAGSVQVLYGTTAGLSGAGDQIWNQNTSGIEGSSEEGDLFGSFSFSPVSHSFTTTLASGNFDGDAVDDLAIGVNREDRFGLQDVGVVHVLFGTATGEVIFADGFEFGDTSAWSSAVP